VDGNSGAPVAVYHSGVDTYEAFSMTCPHAGTTVSLTVGHGDFFGVLGPNGAGKTTLLEIIEGLREADSGSVTVLGQPVWPRNPALLQRLGVQLQASAFFERLTTRRVARCSAMRIRVLRARRTRASFLFISYLFRQSENAILASSRNRARQATSSWFP